MGHDRAKAAARKAKGKGKESSSSQSEHYSSTMGAMLSTLKKMSTTFVKVQLWKKWNKLKERSTTDMNEEELENHRLALKLIEKDLNFTEATVEEEEDMDEEDDE
jgi:predicted choloylglycine hydrolase